jgi:hypothetical protein
MRNQWVGRLESQVVRSIRRIQNGRGGLTMKRTNALVIALATALMATAAYAGESLDSVEAPRSQIVEAPRHTTDDVEAPRGQNAQAHSTDDVEAPRSLEAQ